MDQCKEIEENNKMGKTRHLFKKIRDPKGTFHAKIGTTKGRNGVGLAEACDARERVCISAVSRPRPECSSLDALQFASTL